MHMKAFRACFWFSDILPTANAARISMSFDETTGISENENGKMINDEYYNLQGQRVTAPVKGIYIHNGKVIIKK